MRAMTRIGKIPPSMTARGRRLRRPKPTANCPRSHRKVTVGIGANLACLPTCEAKMSSWCWAKWTMWTRRLSTAKKWARPAPRRPIIAAPTRNCAIIRFPRSCSGATGGMWWRCAFTTARVRAGFSRPLPPLQLRAGRSAAPRPAARPRVSQQAASVGIATLSTCPNRSRAARCESRSTAFT